MNEAAGASGCGDEDAHGDSVAGPADSVGVTAATTEATTALSMSIASSSEIANRGLGTRPGDSDRYRSSFHDA
jgi:hypothetical protein